VGLQPLPHRLGVMWRAMAQRPERRRDRRREIVDCGQLGVERGRDRHQCTTILTEFAARSPNRKRIFSIRSATVMLPAFTLRQSYGFAPMNDASDITASLT